MIKVATPYTAFGGDECASVVCLPMNDTVVSCDTDVEISGWGSAAIGKNRSFCLSLVCLFFIYLFI